MPLPGRQGLAGPFKNAVVPPLMRVSRAWGWLDTVWWRLGANLFNLLGVGALAAVGAHWTWHEWQTPDAVAAEAPPTFKAAVVPSRLAALFGDTGTMPPARSPADGSPVSYVLTGIVLSGSAPGQAVLRPAQSGVPLAAFQGEEIPGGYRVASVEHDTVTLSRNGLSLKLSLPQPGSQNGAERSTSANAAPQPPPEPVR